MVFFIKQKTAYEMRISDWSSDVCSSDLEASFGAYDGGYELRGTFAAAGQGLLSGSDVRIRGVNVGEVSNIRLVDNRALIRIRIEDGTQIPESEIGRASCRERECQ